MSLAELEPVARRHLLHGIGHGEDCERIPLEDYNMGLHIGSVFIILVASVLGCVVPVILRNVRSGAVQVVLKLGTFFAFGTIISTSLIHMLAPGQEELSSECLPESWNDAYEGWGYLFFLIAVFFMQAFDFAITGMIRRREGGAGGLHLHSHGGVDAIDEAAGDHGAEVVGRGAVGEQVVAGGAEPGCGAGLGDTGACTKHKACGERLLAGEDDEDDLEAGAGVGVATLVGGHPAAVAIGGDASSAGSLKARKLHASSSTASSLAPSSPVADATKPHPLSVVLLEAGIVFHSVVIGITLGVTTGSQFVTLLIVLCFHQFMEGFALGFAAVHSAMTLANTLLVGAIYSLSTPVGVAIGIGIRETYNSSDKSTIYVQGVFDSVSGGILLYVGLAQFLTHHFTHNAWVHSQRTLVKLAAFFALYLGAAVMVIIGKWA